MFYPFITLPHNVSSEGQRSDDSSVVCPKRWQTTHRTVVKSYCRGQPISWSVKPMEVQLIIFYYFTYYWPPHTSKAGLTSSAEVCVVHLTKAKRLEMRCLLGTIEIKASNHIKLLTPSPPLTFERVPPSDKEDSLWMTACHHQHYIKSPWDWSYASQVGQFMQ